MKETAYLLQAALICTWWIGLASSHAFFAAFQYNGISPAAFWSFFAPDILLIASLSAIRAYRKTHWLDYVVLGAFGYGTLYCCNASILTGSGLLPTSLMLVGLTCNAFLCFNESFFRSSTSNNALINGLKTLIQIVCIWILSLVVIPYVILDSFGDLSWPKQSLARSIGIALFVAFSSLGLTSACIMVKVGRGTPLPLDQTNALVTTGPYRFVRNPMAIAGIGQGLAIAVIFQSIPILVYSLLGALLWQVVVRPLEERDLERRFGDAYLKYRKRVTCWFPRLP